jgi:hypothetical protein
MKYRNRSVIPVRAVASCLVVGVFGLGIAACGSSSSSSTGSAAVAGTSVASSNARYQARLNLAKCLRSHNLNVPDPSPNGGVAGGGGGGIFRSLSGVPRTQVQAAMTACQQYVKQAFPAANLTPAQQEQFRQAFVKYADCMRTRGINIPDPGSTGSTTGGTTGGTTGAPGGGFGFRGAISSAERNSPAFKSANQACASLRPRFGRGGAGGGTTGA